MSEFTMEGIEFRQDIYDKKVAQIIKKSDQISEYETQKKPTLYN